MSRSGAGASELSEAFQEFLTGAAKLLFGLGAAVTLVTVGLLVFVCFRVTAADGQAIVADAIANVAIFQKILVVSIVALMVGSTYLFWGEEVLGVLQLLGAAALFFAPLYLPSLIAGAETNEAIRAALAALQFGGTVLGVLALAVLVVEIADHARTRAKRGAKADQLKYGKGIKEEADRQNVFMGRCWQLPFCRKFVRERCPIYHARRTCWKERVGCMCEEEVIRHAMENRIIPKDAVLAAQYIPRNQRLTDAQKFERCKTCVIYNEHQRHKYRLLLPVVLVSFVLLYALLHGSLVGITGEVVQKINAAVNSAVIANGQFQTPTVFVEGLLFVFLLVALSYSLKLLEFVIFRLKL